MIETLTYKGQKYPKFQAEGFAARFAFPFALEVCKGYGVDVGYSKPEWKLPGATGVDYHKFCLIDGGKESEADGVDANHLVSWDYNFIFSSHCLEHLPNWVETLNYWRQQLKDTGTIFLYLPHPDQEYWRPWNNTKHIHILYPSMIKEYLIGSGGWTNIFVGERDLNHSFMVIAEKF